ncbi:MAG TPA: hypothetical protein VFG15_27445 [Amycolatopsis sp.]|nr:hypothetical protein [Amycolatopsis sp.]
MSSIKIDTVRLVDLLDRLVPTASKDTGDGATAGILLHTARGEYGDEPGKTDLLVGTSTDRLVIGHDHTPCHGSLGRATLWGVNDVKTLLAAFKPKAKDSKDDDPHMVLVDLAGEHIVVSEDPDLYDDGLSVSFQVQNLDDYPRGLWTVLEVINPGPYEMHDGRTIEASRRTDMSPRRIAPFNKVASKLGESVQFYRTHQHRHVLVQIGDTYRGALVPSRYDDDLDDGSGPAADVYEPNLPPEPKRQQQPMKVFTPTPANGQEPLPGLADLERDTKLLAKVAELVITTQCAMPSVIARGARINTKRANDLLETLAHYHVVGPPALGRPRAVLVAEGGLEGVLAAIRNAPMPEELEGGSDEQDAEEVDELDGDDE